MSQALISDSDRAVIVISARPYGQRAVLKFGQYTGANYLAGRYTPGTFTNQIEKAFQEPRLLIITDPRTDSQVFRIDLPCQDDKF